MRDRTFHDISSSPTLADWRVFVERVAGTSGLLLFLAGVIFFMAWNWQEMHRFLKFAVVELLFALLAAYAFIRWKHWSADIALLGLGTAMGALLALYGQVYQTGADTWELFRAWCLMLIPLTALRLRAGQFFLLWLAASLWLALYLNQTLGGYHFYANMDSLYFIVPQICFWAAAEILHRRALNFDTRRMLARGLGALALICLTVGATGVLLSLNRYGGYYSSGSSSAMLILLYFATIIPLGHVYLKRVPDLFFLSLGVFSLASLICVFMSKAVLDGWRSGAGVLLFLGLFYIGVFIGGAKLIFGLRKRLHPQQAPDESQPWYMKIPLVLGIWVGSLFILGFLAVSLAAMEETGIGFLGLCLIGLGIALSRFSRGSFIQSQFSLAALFCGLGFSGFLTDFNAPGTPMLYAVIFLFLWAGLESPAAKSICFAAAMGSLLLFTAYYPELLRLGTLESLERMPDEYSGLSQLQYLRLSLTRYPGILIVMIVLGSALAVAIWEMNAAERLREESAGKRMAAGAMAGLLLFMMAMSIADCNPLFSIIDGARRNYSEISILDAPARSVVFALAACLAFCLVKQRAAPFLLSAGTILTLLAWFSPGSALGLTLAAMGRQRGSFKLMAAGLSYLAIAVILYYYFLGESLFHKSILLMFTGLALMALALAARRLPGRVEGEYGQ